MNHKLPAFVPYFYSFVFVKLLLWVVSEVIYWIWFGIYVSWINFGKIFLFVYFHANKRLLDFLIKVLILISIIHIFNVFTKMSIAFLCILYISRNDCSVYYKAVISTFDISFITIK